MKDLSYPHVFEPATEPGRPPLLLLHGTGGNEHDLLRLGRAISPGSALLSPRGKVSEGGALRFFARLAEGVFDPNEIERRTHDLADFVTAATTRYDLNARTLVAGRVFQRGQCGRDHDVAAAGSARRRDSLPRHGGARSSGDR
jgi:predicted esterase